MPDVALLCLCDQRLYRYVTCCCFTHLEQSATTRYFYTDFPKKRLKLFGRSFPSWFPVTYSCRLCSQT